MSMTICCHFINGIRFRLEDAIKETPHPLWGKCKFDPETGEKVTPTITDKSLYHRLVNMVDSLDSRGEHNVATTYDHSDESRMCFVGDVVSVRAWEDKMWANVNIDNLPGVKMDLGKLNKLIDLLIEAGVGHERGCFLVQYAS